MSFQFTPLKSTLKFQVDEDAPSIFETLSRSIVTVVYDVYFYLSNDEACPCFRLFNFLYSSLAITSFGRFWHLIVNNYRWVYY